MEQGASGHSELREGLATVGQELRRDATYLLDWEDEWHLAPLNALKFSMKQEASSPAER